MSDVAHIPHQCVLPLERWGAKLLRITGMIIQARLVLEGIFFHKALELEI